MTLFYFITLSFLLGSLNGAMLVSKIYRLPDPRQHGSFNPGASNISRLYGLKLGFFVFLFDFFKIFILLYTVIQTEALPKNQLSFLALSAVSGHCFSPFLGFNGGKGVATLLGSLWALELKKAIIVTFLWGAFYALTSLAALSSISISFFLAGSLLCNPIDIPMLLTLITIIWRHRSNWKSWKT